MTKLDVTQKPFQQPLTDWYKQNGLDHATYNLEPSLTRQEFAEECDINSIMARYQTTGMWPAPVGEPSYVDWTEMPTDLMDSMQRMHDAEKAFMTLPAVVRREFDNDPIAFVDFASDPANLDQMREWKLAPTPKEEPAYVPVPPPGDKAAEPPKAPVEPPKAV